MESEEKEALGISQNMSGDEGNVDEEDEDKGERKRVNIIAPKPKGEGMSAIRCATGMFKFGSKRVLKPNWKKSIKEKTKNTNK